MSDTRIKIRDLTEQDMDRIADLLRYGDKKKIALRVETMSYRWVRDIIRNRKPDERVWKAAIEYLNELDDVELHPRIAECLEKRD